MSFGLTSDLEADTVKDASEVDLNVIVAIASYLVDSSSDLLGDSVAD